MGSRIAPSLAIVFMGKLEAEALQVDRPQPDMYVRYIDDIWCLWTHGSEALTEYLAFLNSRHPAIQFTIERSDQDGTLPYLDTLISVRQDGSYSTELYFKPMAAPIILPYDSAHARSTKKAVLTSQITRAIRLGSDTAARKRGLEKIRHLFVSNGYPMKMIKEYSWREMKKHEERSRDRGRERRERPDQRQQNKKKQGTYIRLPFVNDKVAAQVKKVAINSGLPVEIAWTTNNTLKKRLVKTRLNPAPCPSGRRCCHSCQAGLQSKCTTKNVVYELTCSHCGDTYIGETSRPVRLRYNEHRRNGINREEDTPLGEHALHKHPEMDRRDISVTAKILRVCKDEADRRIAESIFIRDARPKINDNTTSWQLLPK
ncbi:uncharacterized protein LOC122388700 [Amphibalanus amphitrite]|nr:uncharacterized protein LOC122388698 [Amphibalanus amphitrite]XP_043235933.1 uncharacterized protein LOC122388700 [Amphibalanus amphitrite]